MNPKKSILGERAQTNGGARAAGKIRCGTKVLTKDALQNPQAVKLYQEGVRNRRRASEIESDIKALGIQYPMYPTNTRHFNVSASDFVLPVFADKIIEVYGEGEGADRKLYKFPVMFHSNHMFDFFPHAFESHKGADKFRSAFDANGVRVCETLPNPDSKAIVAQRREGVKRVPRRDWVVRGTCDPRSCKEYQSGQCQFRGRLLFYMPKIAGLGLLSMETSSEYAAENIWSTLEPIREALGYIPKHNPNRPGEPVFWLSKVQEERVYYDHNGQRKTGLQWVPRLTANIDMGTLLALAHDPNGAPTVPKAWLQAPEAQVAAVQEHLPSESASEHEMSPDGAGTVGQQLRTKIEAVLDETGCDKALFSRYVANNFGNDWASREDALRDTLAGLEKIVKYGKDLDVVLESRLLAADFRIDPSLFEAYANAEFGNWSRSFQKMRGLIAAVREMFSHGHAAGLAAMQARVAAAKQESTV